MRKPLDNGAAFFSRVTMVELRQARYTWVSNPLEEYPSRQLARVASQLSINPLCRAEFLLSKNVLLPWTVWRFRDCRL